VIGAVPPSVPVKRLALGGLLADGDWVESKDQDPYGNIRVVQLADISEGQLGFRSNRWINEETAVRLRVTPLKPGDVLIARMPDPLGRCCQVPSELGKAVTVVDVAILRISNPVISPRYAMYAINSSQTRNQVLAMATGSTRRRITRKRLAIAQVPLPTLDEQLRVVRFLDHAELRIAQALESKRRLVALLDERRRGATQSLVTAGVGQIGELKDSGIKWLGAVPAEWDIRPAKFFFREVNERSLRGEEELLSVSHVTGVTPRSSKTITMFMAASYAGHKLCKPGDLIINTMWAWMGALGVTRQIGIVSPAYGVYRPLPSSPLSSAYADLLLRTQPYVDEYTCRSTGIQASRLRLYPDRFLTVPVVCPPPNQQAEIVERAETETRGLTAAITAALAEIALLLEYRATLTSDVVTGKRDVRAEAADFPDVDLAELNAVLSVAIAEDTGQDEEEGEEGVTHAD
jgi:restriction endonuclease S subunit